MLSTLFAHMLQDFKFCSLDLRVFHFGAMEKKAPPASSINDVLAKGKALNEARKKVGPPKDPEAARSIPLSAKLPGGLTLKRYMQQHCLSYEEAVQVYDSYTEAVKKEEEKLRKRRERPVATPQRSEEAEPKPKKAKSSPAQASESKGASKSETSKKKKKNQQPDDEEPNPEPASKASKPKKGKPSPSSQFAAEPEELPEDAEAPEAFRSPPKRVRVKRALTFSEEKKYGGEGFSERHEPACDEEPPRGILRKNAHEQLPTPSSSKSCPKRAWCLDCH